MPLTKSALITRITSRQELLTEKDVELAVKALLEQMVEALAVGQRVEIRGFSLHHRPPRLGRNPKTGEKVAVGSKYVPHFKPGKELKDRVDEAAAQEG